MKSIKKAIVLLLCVSLFSAMALGSGESDTSSSAKKVGETTSTEKTVDDVKEAAEQIADAVSDAIDDVVDETPAVTSEVKDQYVVGETLSVDGLNFTYVSSSNYTSDNDFIQPADGNKYIRLFFHVENQSGSDEMVSVYDFKCYADGYDCSATYFDDDLGATLSNGKTTDGAVYFEVPESATEIEIEYEYDWLNSKKTKFIFEGDKDSGLTFEKNTEASADAFHVGDIIETKKLRITYNKAAEYKSDNMFLQPEEGNKYIYIELEVENLSDTDQSVSYFSFECYADGSACSGFYGPDDLLSADLSSGRKAKGIVAFEVPKDAQTIEIEFEDNFWTESKIIFAYEE